jgi:dienelactone hydrolase
VLTAFPGERSVFELNWAQAQLLAERRSPVSQGTALESLRTRIATLLGIENAASLTPANFEDRGRVEKDDYHIDKLILQREGKSPIPGLTFHPPQPHDDAYLYLHDAGKLGDTQPGGAVEALVHQGYAVVTVDLAGQGETANGKPDQVLTDWKTYYLSYLLGRPMLGHRVEDALAAADFVATYQKDRAHPRRVHLVGAGQAGLVALHAAALAPQLFASVSLKEVPGDWLVLTSQSVPAGQLDSVVHRALEFYDLPDLLPLIGQEKVTLDGQPK